MNNLLDGPFFRAWRDLLKTYPESYPQKMLKSLHLAYVRVSVGFHKYDGTE